MRYWLDVFGYPWDNDRHFGVLLGTIPRLFPECKASLRYILLYSGNWVMPRFDNSVHVVV